MGLKRPDGSRRWMTVRARPLLRPGEHHVHAVLASSTDVTEQREMELHRQPLAPPARQRQRRANRRRRVAVLLVNVSEQEARELAGPAAARLTGFAREHLGADIELSLSVGVAVLDQSCESVEALMASADRAMYRDKRRPGRPSSSRRRPAPPATEVKSPEAAVTSIPELEHLAPAIRAEHERWDGRGYPDGLAGEDIPLASPIAFVCDAYHAMTSDRLYRKALARETAIAEIAAEAGHQFCPAAAQALLEVLEAEHVEVSAAEGDDAREPAETR